MHKTLSETPAKTCDWCGRENRECLPLCSVCGNRLAAEPPPVETGTAGGKSRSLAVLLAVLFGPLGLIYVRTWGTILVLTAVGASLILAQKGGLLLSIGGRVLCAVIAFYEVGKLAEDSTGVHNPISLLDAAARLETVDRSQAIAAYEEIVRLHPNTSASREAARAIKILAATT